MKFIYLPTQIVLNCLWQVNIPNFEWESLLYWISQIHKGFNLWPFYPHCLEVTETPSFEKGQVSYHPKKVTGRIVRGQWNLHEGFYHKPFWYPKNWPWKKSSCFDTEIYLLNCEFHDLYAERKKHGKIQPNKQSINRCHMVKIGWKNSEWNKSRSNDGKVWPPRWLKSTGVARFMSSFNITNRWSFNTSIFNA